MKNTKMKQSIAALAMAAVVAVSLLGYGCGSKSASTTGAGATGDFTGTAKGFGGDVTVTLTLTDGKITGCTAEGADDIDKQILNIRHSFSICCIARVYIEIAAFNSLRPI